MMLELFAGADFLFGAGLLDSVAQMSLEELVVADEVFGMVSRLLRGVTVDREHLAVELIGKLGFKGGYLFDNHTRAHVRELWQAKLGETGTYEGWQAAGAPSTSARAQARVDECWPPTRPRSPPTWAASSTTSSPQPSARLALDVAQGSPTTARSGGVKRNRLKSSARDHPAA